MLYFFRNPQHKNFFRLWLAQLISQFGDRIHQLALVGLIATRFPGSSMALAKVMACTILPVFLIQPFVGVFVDRWDRRLTLFVCDIIRGCLVLLIPFLFIEWDSMIPIYILVFIIFSFSRIYVPAKMSMIPDLVDEDNLLKANSLFTTTGMLAVAFGAALGGFLVEIYGARNGFIIDAMTFFLSAAVLFSMDISKNVHLPQLKDIHPGQTIKKVHNSVWHDLKVGYKYIFEHKEIQMVMKMLFVLLSSAGAVYIVVIVFIQEMFHTVTKDLGILAVFFGIGLLFGALLYGKYGKKYAWYKTIFVCLITGGVMLVGFANIIYRYPHISLAMLCSFIQGLMIGPVFIAANNTAHIVSDEKMRGQVFSALEIVIHVAFLTSMFISSWLSEFIDRVWILTGVGVLVTLAGVVGFFVVKGEGYFEAKK